MSCPEGCSFPVRNGIPRFVPTSAYAAAFGEQWKRWRKTQLDSYTGASITRDRTRRAMGEEAWSQLKALDVLECGCGAGRFTEALLEQGARVTSIDLSEAVDANQESFPQDARHRIAQADILALPFARASFDVVFCLGVLQHTPDPPQALGALYRLVRPGGALLVDHYADRLRWYTRTAPLFRAYMRRKAPEKNQKTIERISRVFLPLHRRARASPTARRVLNRVSPMVTYYHAFPELDDRLQEEWARLDTHDSLTDYYKHFTTAPKLRRHVESLGARVERCEIVNGVAELRARRPGLSP